MILTIIHFDLPTADPEKPKQFYAGVFVWKIEKYLEPMEFWMIHTAPTDDKVMLQRLGVNGGMVKKEKPE